MFLKAHLKLESSNVFIEEMKVYIYDAPRSILNKITPKIIKPTELETTLKLGKKARNPTDLERALQTDVEPRFDDSSSEEQKENINLKKALARERERIQTRVKKRAGKQGKERILEQEQEEREREKRNLLTLIFPHFTGHIFFRFYAAHSTATGVL